MSRPRVVVCGLGPATPDLVTAATAAAIERIPHRFLRTRRHPSAGVVGEARAFDDLYESAATFDQVYGGIVDELAAAAGRHGEVLYAVPGSPVVAESTVERLRADPRVEVEVLPALSFLDLAWDRLGVDPVEAGVRLVDGHRFEVEAAGSTGPLVVAQCDDRQVLSDVKLLLGEVDPAARAARAARDGDADGAAGASRSGRARDGDPGTGGRGPLTVTVLQRLGLPDEAVTTVAWPDLDRVVEPDHLTSLHIPRLAAPVAGEVASFAGVVRRLRRDCPWDREQTHHSLRRHLLEESYEVLEALDHLDPDRGEGFGELEEELGDLLFQIVFHSTLAAEEGHFDLADVARGIREKLVGRHPHVFGDAEARTAADVVARWNQIKKAEKGRASVMDGIPAALPALLYALKVQKRAASEGVDWRSLLPGADGQPGENGDGDGATSAAASATPVPAADPEEARVGRRLLELVDEAGRAGVDPESALRIAAEQVRDRFRAREAGAAAEGRHEGTP